MTKKRVAIKRISDGYLISYGGKAKAIAFTKKEADKIANKLRVKLGKRPR